MTLPRTVSDVVTEHTVFEVECIDRMYLNVYVPLPKELTRRSPLATAWRRLDRTLDRFIEDGLAAA
jgi:hypothetical protein